MAHSFAAIDYRKATGADIGLLAKLNRELICDEGHRNSMTLPQLERRMRNWLRREYTAVIFYDGKTPLAYALYRNDADSIYLRQFFVVRKHRRKGIGNIAMQLLLTKIWPAKRRVTLEVLVGNGVAHEFWKSIGFQEYAMTFEMIRE